MLEPAATLRRIKGGEVWIRRVLGWVYVAIGACICAGVIANIGPFAPAEDSVEARRMEWAPIVFPLICFAGAVFAFAGYWVLTHPRLHRASTIWIAFLLQIGLCVAWIEWRQTR